MRPSSGNATTPIDAGRAEQFHARRSGGWPRPIGAASRRRPMRLPESVSGSRTTNSSPPYRRGGVDDPDALPDRFRDGLQHPVAEVVAESCR